MERTPIKKTEPTKRGNYFLDRKTDLKFVPSGCTLLDCVLGGGYPLGRVANIVGDKSSGKTLLAIEALTNFTLNYPDGKGYYRESEAAFDDDYANALGAPMNRIDKFPDGEDDIFETIEDFYEDLNKVTDTHKSSEQPAYYVLDSLDALSDRAEMKRGIDEGTYGASKPKQLSQMFRRLVRKVKDVDCTLMIISQVRDNIGVTFGERHTRSGGKALDFYCSQIIWLAQTGRWERTVKGVKRPIGITIKARCKKNKIGLPFRECEFPIRFGFGIDNVRASLEWLESIKRLSDFDPSIKNTDTYLRQFEDDSKAYHQADRALDPLIRQIWKEVEKVFMPTMRKYGN